MEHHQAIDLHPFLTARRLRGEERAEFYRHLSECADCASWTETHSLIANGLSDGAWAEHPPSDLLARSAVGLEPLSGAERELLDGHLAACEACRETLDLAGEALSAARGGAADDRARLFGAGTRRRLALAAAVILGLALLLTLRTATPPGSPVALEDSPAASTEEFVAAVVVEAVTTLSNDTLAGKRLVEAGRAISATAVQIETGSDVTFRAGESVVLGDGFAVDADARFAIEIAGVDPRTAPDKGT